MKDIDFDELDRAVSSVLGQKDSPALNESTPEAVEVSSNSAVTTPKVSSPLAQKRRGRFMDVMHPAATTKPTETPSPTRKSPVLEPLLPEHTESTVVIEPSEPPQSTEASEPTKAGKPSKDKLPNDSTVDHLAEPIASLDESSALIGAEPAPVENGPTVLPTPDTSTSSAVDSQNNVEELAKTPEDSESTTDDPLAGEAPAILAGSSLSDSIPQTSPFLTDTKVDKRPLVGSADESDTSSLGNTEREANHPTGETQTAPTVPLPRELQPDVVEVESAQENADEAVSVSPFAANVDAAPDTANDGRVEGHPLFDTSTYHEPIIAVHDSTFPTWAKWLIGLAGCLVVGAGVGYFLFTAGL